MNGKYFPTPRSNNGLEFKACRPTICSQSFADKKVAQVSSIHTTELDKGVPLSKGVRQRSDSDDSVALAQYANWLFLAKRLGSDAEPWLGSKQTDFGRKDKWVHLYTWTGRHHITLRAG